MATVDSYLAKLMAAEKAFLFAAQSGELDTVMRLLADEPGLVHARSSSKGYSAQHYAAMSGANHIVEWLHSNGLPATTCSESDIAPLQVALEYKRLSTARLIQRLRDSGRARDAAAPPPPKRKPPTAQEVANSFAPPELLAAQKARDAAAPPPPKRTPPTAQEVANSFAPPALLAAQRQRAAAAPPPTARPAAPLPATTMRAAPAASARPAPPPASPSAPPPPPPAPRADLGVANRDAAEQALAAGERALCTGDVRKAVRLLTKAQALSPSDERVAAALAEARAMLRELDQVDEGAGTAARSSGGGAAATANTAPHGGGGRDAPAAEAPRRPPAPEEAAPSRRRDATGGDTGDESSGGGSTSAWASATAAAAAAVAAARGGGGAAEASAPAVGRRGKLLRLATRVGGATVALVRLLISLLALGWSAAGGPRARRVSGRWAEWLVDKLNPLAGEPELQERLSYLLYYWCARLRSAEKLRVFYSD